MHSGSSETIGGVLLAWMAFSGEHAKTRSTTPAGYPAARASWTLCTTTSGSTPFSAILVPSTHTLSSPRSPGSKWVSSFVSSRMMSANLAARGL